MSIYIIAAKISIELAKARNGNLIANVGETSRDINDRLKDDDYRRKTPGGEWIVIHFYEDTAVSDKDIHKLLKKHPRVKWNNNSNTEEFTFLDDNGNGDEARRIVNSLLHEIENGKLKSDNTKLVKNMQTLMHENVSLKKLCEKNSIFELDTLREELASETNLNAFLRLQFKNKTKENEDLIAYYQKELHDRELKNKNQNEDLIAYYQKELHDRELKIKKQNEENLLLSSENLTNKMTRNVFATLFFGTLFLGLFLYIHTSSPEKSMATQEVIFSVPEKKKNDKDIPSPTFTPITLDPSIVQTKKKISTLTKSQREDIIKKGLQPSTFESMEQEKVDRYFPPNNEKKNESKIPVKKNKKQVETPVKNDVENPVAPVVTQKEVEKVYSPSPKYCGEYKMKFVAKVANTYMYKTTVPVPKISKEVWVYCREKRTIEDCSFHSESGEKLSDGISARVLNDVSCAWAVHKGIRK